MNRTYAAWLFCCLLFPARLLLAQTAAGSEDIGWPRQITQNGTTLLYYQPQVNDWPNYTKLTCQMAFSLTPKGGRQLLGVASIECTTATDKESRTVYCHDIKATDVRFPSLNGDSLQQMTQLLKTLLPAGSEAISMDRIMADMDQSKVSAKGIATKNDPPQIFYSAVPAILVLVDGTPVESPIPKNDLKFIVNTNWDILLEQKKDQKQYYLLADKTWLTATDLKGPWQPALTLPKDMSKLPSGENFDDLKKQVPPSKQAGAPPTVFFSSTPAELILLQGKPVFSRIPSTGLLYVSNTDNDLFLNDTEQAYYVLLSGRWFKAKDLNGPWTYAGDQLPADFAKIPADSPKSHVLSAVPGTVEASDAVMLAQIPTTAVVNKKEAEAKVKVQYDGTPKFSPIESTKLEYATNTQDKIIKDGDLYYLCFQGVWFMSTKPDGPWKTADNIPAEIYTIPPSSPVYNVTYVTQTNATAETVESSTTGGYFGMFVLGMVTGAVIAYGTGWYHPPYIFYPPGIIYPIYRPWPATYGAGAVYNPWTGGWAAGRRAYGPYGSVGSSAWYNPATGRYGRAASVQGIYGGRTVASGYNPWTGSYGSTVQHHNSYAQWGSSAVTTRNGQWAQTGHVTTARGTATGYRTSTGQSGVVTHGARGTVAHTTNGVYAGHDGNVYKRNGTGQWSQYNNGNWNKVQHPTATTQQLNRAAQSRQRGQVQTQRFNNARQARPAAARRPLRR